MSQIIQITNWAVNASGDQYRAPELRVAILRGEVSAHPALEVRPGDNKVRTSQIRGWIGRTVMTQNSTYQLVGDPDPEFLSWLQSKQFRYDPANPLKVLADYGYLPEEG